MGTKSVLLLGPLQDTLSTTGIPVRSDKWVSRSNGLYTVAIHVSNFQGTVYIEASVASSPGDADWFPAIPPLVFPQIGYVPLINVAGQTISICQNFNGRYSWIRARIDRNYLPELNIGALPSSVYGLVDRILLNF